MPRPELLPVPGGGEAVVHFIAPTRQDAQKKVLLFKTGPGPVKQVGAPIPLADDATAVALVGADRDRAAGLARHVPRRDPGPRPGGQHRHVAAARPPRAARDHLRPRRCPGAAASPSATSACSRRAAPVAGGQAGRVRRRPARRALGVHGAPRRLERDRRPRRAHPRRRLPRSPRRAAESGVYLFDVRTPRPATSRSRSPSRAPRSARCSSSCRR